MADSYAVLPVNSEVRAWLQNEDHVVPENDGRTITLPELKSIVSSLPDVSAKWGEGPEFYDGHITLNSGTSTTLIVGNPGHGGTPCEFHFRGGEAALIEKVVKGIAAFAGPQVIYAHSGSFTKVVQGGAA